MEGSALQQHRNDPSGLGGLVVGLAVLLAAAVFLLAMAFVGRSTPGTTSVAQGPGAGAPLPGTSAQQPGRTTTAGSSGVADIDVYRGLGSWVDIYEKHSFADPEGTVADMRSHGVRTLYIETTNYKRHRSMKFPAKQARFIEAAHAAGMRVVAWYLPGFRDLKKDYWRSMKAITFRTPSGDGFDSFALDIESPLVEDPAVRTERLLLLSERLRAAVGTGYAMAAIIPSPKGMVDHPDYWPGFPYRELDRLYDAFLPMTYFTWRVEGGRAAAWYATQVIRIIRQQVGDRGVPIHVIGGISDESTRPEARGFVRALRREHVIGGSYYAFQGMTAPLWWELGKVPVG